MSFEILSKLKKEIEGYQDKAEWEDVGRVIEVGLGAHRRITILDTFGTPDEDRYVATDALQEGRIVHVSKEVIRQLFIANGYYRELMVARAGGRDDPPYPDLTHDEIEMVSHQYKRFAEAYTSVKLDVSFPEFE